MNQSKIIKVTSKFYEAKAIRYYEIEFENGEKGTISNDNENAYKVGQELKYTLTEQKAYPGKFRVKEVKDKKSFPQKNYNAEFSMKALECASRSGTQNIYELADKYFDRLKKKSLSSNNG